MMAASDGATAALSVLDLAVMRVSTAAATVLEAVSREGHSEPNLVLRPVRLIAVQSALQNLCSLLKGADGFSVRLHAGLFHALQVTDGAGKRIITDDGLWNGVDRDGNSIPVDYITGICDSAAADKAFRLEFGEFASRHLAAAAALPIAADGVKLPAAPLGSSAPPRERMAAFIAALPVTASAEEKLQLLTDALPSFLVCLPASSTDGVAAPTRLPGLCGETLQEAGAVLSDGLGGNITLPTIPVAPKLSKFLPGLDPRKNEKLRITTTGDGALCFSTDGSSGPVGTLELAEFLQCSYAAKEFYYSPLGVGEAYSVHITDMIDKYKGPFTARQLTAYDQAHRQKWEENRGSYDLGIPSNALFQKFLMAPTLALVPPVFGPSHALTRTGGAGRPLPSSAAVVRQAHAAGGSVDKSKSRCWAFARGACMDRACVRSHDVCDACAGASFPKDSGCPNGHKGPAVNPGLPDLEKAKKRRTCALASSSPLLTCPAVAVEICPAKASCASNAVVGAREPSFAGTDDVPSFAVAPCWAQEEGAACLTSCPRLKEGGLTCLSVGPGTLATETTTALDVACTHTLLGPLAPVVVVQPPVLCSRAAVVPCCVGLPPTSNTSPLALCIRQWYEGLCAVHDTFCEHRHSAAGGAPPCARGACHCRGLRPLGFLLSSPQWPPPSLGEPRPCNQATEAELLVCEIYWGFSLLPPGVTPDAVPPFRVDNYPISERAADAISKTIAAELEAGRLVEVADRPAHTTAIYGKEEGPVKVRTITDFSKPEGCAVNDFTDNMHFSMQSHEDAFALLSPGCFMAKTDIEAAYRTVGVHPSQHHLLSFAWRDLHTGVMRYFSDTRLPFGHAKAPEIFCRLSAAVRAMMVTRGFDATVVFVDDFFLVAGEPAACQAAQDELSRLLRSLGFSESFKKRLSPSQCQIFLGLQYNSATPGPHPVTITVPEEKLRKAETLAAVLVARPTVSLKTLQSAVGYFSHISCAVWSARAFTRRLIDAIKAARRGPHRQHHNITVTRAMRLDFQWWLRFARTFNGRAILLDKPRMLTGFFATDASNVGMGGFLSGRHFSTPWDIPIAVAWTYLPLSVQSDKRLRARVTILWPRLNTPSWHDIQFRELFALVWSHLLWGETHLANFHVTVHNDNTTVVHDVNFMTSPNVHRMALLRMLFTHCAQHNIRSCATRISSEANVLADAASRLDTVAFRLAEARWHATVAQTHPAWPGGEVSEYLPRVRRNPGLYTHRAAVLVRHAPSVALCDGLSARDVVGL